MNLLIKLGAPGILMDLDRTLGLSRYPKPSPVHVRYRYTSDTPTLVLSASRTPSATDTGPGHGSHRYPNTNLNPVLDADWSTFRFAAQSLGSLDLIRTASTSENNELGTPNPRCQFLTWRGHVPKCNDLGMRMC